VEWTAIHKKNIYRWGHGGKVGASITLLVWLITLILGKCN